MTLQNRIVSLGSRLFTFDELKRAYHRLGDRSIPLHTPGSRIAFGALRVAKSFRMLSTLQLGYVASKPLVDRHAPPGRIYDAHHLHLRLNRIYDLPEVMVDNLRVRSVNVLVPAFEFRSMSAGFFGVFQVAQFFSRMGYNVRLVMFDNFYFDREKFRTLLQGYPGLERLFDNCETEYIGERAAPLRVNEADICVATVWYSAYFAEKIHRQLRRKDFIYLIQDYETAFYPGSSSSSQADASYELNYTAMFSSRSLRDHFLDHDIGGIRSRALPYIYFNNACAARLPSRRAFLGAKGRARKKRLAFYSRPVVDRNMFELAALVLCEAYARGILNRDEWDCYGMGLGEGVVQLAPGLTTTTLPRMNLQEYLDVVSSFDICLTLMASPHPSMIPMDLACSGALVVTNTFQAKTADYLRELCANIIPASPSLESLLEALAEAVARSDDIEARYDAALASSYPRTWDETFTAEHEQFFRRVIDRNESRPLRSPIPSIVAPTQNLFAPPALDQDKRTYVIVGSGRGGTSMVAGVIAATGTVSLMPEVDNTTNYEDLEIVFTAQGRDVLQQDLGLEPADRRNRLLDIIRQRNAAADIWGWKDPSADLYLEDIAAELRNPHLIFVCRDLAAVVGSHVSIHGSGPESAMDDVIARYQRYWDIAKRLNLPTLLVSYERGKQKPQQLLDELARFLGCEISPDARRLVTDFVSDAGGYRKLPRRGL